MAKSRNWTAAGYLVGFLCLAGGCGGSQSPTPENPMEGVALGEIAEAYRAYSVLKNSPPTKLADLEPMTDLSPIGIEALKSGEIMLNYGAKLPDFAEEGGQSIAPEILAYQKKVPTEGGYILQLDRRIKKMTADEFKAAPKAGKS